MVDFVTAIAVYIGLWAGTTTLVWFAFKRMSEASSDVGKEHATTQLTGTSWTARANAWPRAFVDGFDGIFGAKHFRWKCLWRSLVVSAAVCALLALLWWALYPSHASAWLTLIQDDFNDDPAHWVVFAAFFVAVLLVGNGLGDYVSLLETRTLLRILAGRTGVKAVTLVLLLDVVLTTFVWIAF